MGQGREIKWNEMKWNNVVRSDAFVQTHFMIGLFFIKIAHRKCHIGQFTLHRGVRVPARHPCVRGLFKARYSDLSVVFSWFCWSLDWLMRGFLNYATHATQVRALRKDITQRTQRNELLHGKDRPTMYKIETFKVAVLFVLLWKKRRRQKRKAYTLDKRYFFIRATIRGEFSLFNVRTRPRIISSQLPVLPSLIVLFSKVGPATAAIRSVHELSLSGETTPCDWSNLALLAWN